MANLRDIHIYLCHTGDGVQHSGVDLISIDVLKLWHIPVLYIFLGVLSTQKKKTTDMTIRIVHMGTCCKHWFCHQVGTEDNKNGCCTIGHVRVHLITRSAGKRKVEFSKFEGYPSSCPYFQGAAGIATPARYFEFQAAPRSLKAQLNYGIKIIKTEEQLNYGTYQKCLKVSLILIIYLFVDVYCFPA